MTTHEELAERPVPQDTPPRAARPRRRRVALIAGLLAVAVAASALGWVVWSTNQPEPTVAAPALPTVQVTTGSMLAETNAAGSLQYAFSLPVVSGPGGTVTELPPVGSTVAPGGVLYRVDTLPVVLMRGSMPAWRDFSSDMSDGEDIRQLETNLQAFGFFTREPDARFTWDTVVAIRDWQRSLGVQRTGVVERSRILFTDQDLRVNSQDARVGSQVGAGSPLYQSTGLLQVVDTSVRSADRKLAVPGSAVTIALPTGTDIAGTIESIGAPTVKPNADGKGTSVVLPVRIAVADQDAVRDLALANVTVRLTSTLRDDVLTVPVDALVPIDDTNYAVEVPSKTAGGTRTLIPVTVGAFSSGNVEISGNGIAAGLDVVVPAR